MSSPNTLIFVDLPSDDVEACARFYHDVFGWFVEGRPTGEFHRAVPGGFFPLDDGSDSPVGNLHLGFSQVTNMRPHPDPAGVEPRHMSTGGRSMRVWILIGDNDTDEGRALNRRVELTVTDADPAAGGVVTEQAGKAEQVVTPPIEDTMPPAEAGAMELEAPAEAPAPAPAAAGATAAVSIIDYEYQPKVTTVKAGGTVTWTNNDRVTHTVTFDGTDIKVKSAETYSRSYPAAGTFEYKCGIHPTMFGSVVVVP